eukprot:6195767-Pleurochrysis_carterae.AAC.1
MTLCKTVTTKRTSCCQRQRMYYFATVHDGGNDKLRAPSKATLSMLRAATKAPPCCKRQRQRPAQPLQLIVREKDSVRLRLLSSCKNSTRTVSGPPHFLQMTRAAMKNLRLAKTQYV